MTFVGIDGPVYAGPRFFGAFYTSAVDAAAAAAPRAFCLLDRPGVGALAAAYLAERHPSVPRLVFGCRGSATATVTFGSADAAYAAWQHRVTTIVQTWPVLQPLGDTFDIGHAPADSPVRRVATAYVVDTIVASAARATYVVPDSIAARIGALLEEAAGATEANRAALTAAALADGAPPTAEALVHGGASPEAHHVRKRRVRRRSAKRRRSVDELDWIENDMASDADASFQPVSSDDSASDASGDAEAADDVAVPASDDVEPSASLCATLASRRTRLARVSACAFVADDDICRADIPTLEWIAEHCSLGDEQIAEAARRAPLDEFFLCIARPCELWPGTVFYRKEISVLADLFKSIGRLKHAAQQQALFRLAAMRRLDVGALRRSYAEYESCAACGKNAQPCYEVSICTDGLRSETIASLADLPLELRSTAQHDATRAVLGPVGAVCGRRLRLAGAALDCLALARLHYCAVRGTPDEALDARWVAVMHACFGSMLEAAQTACGLRDDAEGAAAAEGETL